MGGEASKMDGYTKTPEIQEQKAQGLKGSQGSLSGGSGPNPSGSLQQGPTTTGGSGGTVIPRQ
jgi:hypothetical protein